MAVDPAEARGLVEIIQLLRDGRPRTRVELVELTGRGRSTITNRLERLTELRLVRPIGATDSTGGRPPIAYAIDTSSRIVVAVDVGSTHVRLALTDLARNILVERHEPISTTDTPEHVFDRVVAITNELLTTLDRPLSDIVGVGIGVPASIWAGSTGPRNPAVGVGWDAVDASAALSPRLGGAIVLVDNDANLSALGEHSAFYPSVRTLLFVKVATGIGAGIIADGRLMHGEGAAGDIAHVTIPSASGMVCRCGNTGCVEAIAGGVALQADLASQGLPVTSNADIIDLVRAGNAVATKRLRSAGRDIGQVLAACVSVLNPAVIVVGGKLAEAGEQLLAGIRESVYGHSLPQATQELRVVTSRAEGRAGVLGASQLVVDHILSEAGLVGLD